ncbi:hypothetical protein [Microbacterium sp. Root180]|uniref:DUF7882 family protein n=1 Tax=Microbacterium sp. Root180 TaxID=1736483 RepID=UPI0006F3C3BD|nr:hypothetical protein [Microbacterium sp. Root180]KRB36731.1 hypothetical protein ASD93_11875 [Microbacterium sp. Root180]
MGQLYYGDTAEPIDIPDRLLAHLKVVITTKLRRAESFTLTWRHHDGDAAGRSSLWLQESIPLRFVFESAEAEQLDAGALQDMAHRASSSSGLTVDFDDLPAERGIASLATVA